MRPRILFITDDRESYKLGNYYLAYQRAFARNAELTLCHPLEPQPHPDGFDVVVLGHSCVENFTRIYGARLLPDAVVGRLWFRHSGLRALRRTRTPTVLFTKNDYKNFDIKNSFIDYLQPRLIISHTRSALPKLTGNVKWMPFGVDTEQFSGSDAPRPIQVGFKANANSEWNAGERERFYHALQRLDGRRPVSLLLADHGEGFLIGSAYADWMRGCSLLGNTVSAAGTVGPRFLEAMACGTVPLAPRNAYEGLLIPDVHYVAVDAGPDGSFADLEAVVDRFFEDPLHQAQMRESGQALAHEHSVDRHVITVLQEVGT